MLELLPTVTESILEALPSEQITDEIKKKRSGRTAATSEIAPSEVSLSGNADEDGRSLSSFQSENFVHASQMGASNLGDSSLQSSAKSKARLWNDLKISCEQASCTFWYIIVTLSSHHPLIHPPLHRLPPLPPHPHPTQPTRPPQLLLERRLLRVLQPQRPHHKPRKP